MSSIIPKVQIKEEKFDPDETDAKKVPKEKKRIKCKACRWNACLKSGKKSNLT